MTPEQLAALMAGMTEVQSGVKGLKEGSTALATRMQTLEEKSAATEKNFLEWRKQGLRMSPEQRSRRGLGNKSMNEAFGKALVLLAREKQYCPEVFGKAMTDTNIVSVDYAAELIRLVEERGVIRGLARHVPMGSGTTNWPRRTAGITAAHVAAGSAITESNATTGQVQLVADTILALSLVQKSSLEDSVVDLGAYVAEEIAYGFATIEDNDALNGDGTATNGGIEGLFAASLYLLTNKPTQVSLAAGKTSFEDVTFKPLMQCIDAVRSAALKGSVWLMHRSIRTLLREVEDSQGRPIWEMNTQAGQPELCLGYPVVVCDQAPARTASAAATRFLLFGNFDYWFFGDRRQMGIVADESRYREYDQVGFFGSERVAQNIADGNAFAVLKTAA